VSDLQFDTMRADELAERMRATLATAITPVAWDDSEDIGVVWWTVRYPDRSVITGFEGIGAILIEPFGSTWSVGLAVARPDLPGADARRAWLNAAIRTVAGPTAIVVDSARIVKKGEA
jgi:hypothetical protein